ncbi:MAG: hypothetical protein JOS17DRAFT_749084 [Linnemannia elongata]|nr:MAG: hypothetical protein JOS17DRAFT_749084 [Linnemannia elongata]
MIFFPLFAIFTIVSHLTSVQSLQLRLNVSLKGAAFCFGDINLADLQQSKCVLMRGGGQNFELSCDTRADAQSACDKRVAASAT